MTRHLFTDADHDRIAAAIRSAESRTAGEIYCVLARTSDSYFFPAAFVVSAAVMGAGLAMAVLARVAWYDPGLPLFAAAQLAAWLSALGLLRVFPGLRIRMVPRRLAWRRAHDNAARQFLARNLHRTEARTGVLIFVSLAERYAEVIADSGIDRHVGPESWDSVVRTLLEHAGRDMLPHGFVLAVEQVGEILARHVPPAPADRNELDDHLIEV